MFENLKKFFNNPFFTSPIVVFTVWTAVALVCAILKVSLGAGEYNNFMIFRGVAEHFFSEQPLYVHYPEQYSDLNHYGPLFAFVIAPLAWMPAWLAMPVWVVGSSVLLYWAVRELPLEVKMGMMVLWISINDLFTAAAMQQFNILTAAMVIGSFVMIQKRKEGWAALFIVIGTFVKIYGIIGLAFFFFAKRKWRFIFYMILWSILAMFMPLLFVSGDYLWGEYQAWFADIAAKNLENIRIDQLYQNVSILGTIRKVSGSTEYSDLPIMAGGVVAFLLTYLRWKQFKFTSYRLVMLASLLIFTVIFSSGSENSGYIIATIGVGIWWATLEKRTPLMWVLLVLVLIASFARNLFPADFYRNIIFKYALRSVPYTLVWIHTIWQLWFRDFAPKFTKKSHADLINTPIDIVLPCYNPHGAWAQNIVESFNALKELCPSHKMHLFVVNDGSTNGNFDKGANYITQQIPNATIVDNKINQGKGGAVRSGVALTTAPLVVYTDYDFPYQISCTRNLIARLEKGADIVIAARNESYHKKLSPMRKLLSFMSRNLNWLVLGMKYSDAQGGLKGFNARGREVFLKTKVNRFLFDTEFIYKASKRTDLRISQISANLRPGIHLPAMSIKTMKHEAMNFVRIIFTA